MSSIFIETISKAISDYRQLLKRYLPHADRMMKLIELGLKQPNYKNEIMLYRTAQRIIQDIETNLDHASTSYYAYSGINSFGRYLKEFLSNYTIESNRVIHCTQKASRALLDSIQLMGLTANQLTPEILEKINENSRIVACYGSKEQCKLYKNYLERCYREHGDFFDSPLCYFKKQTLYPGKISEAA